MNVKQSLVLTASLIFAAGAGMASADSGEFSVANQRSESQVYQLQGEALAQYYIEQGEATAAGQTMSEPMMTRQEQFANDGLTAAQRKLMEIGNNN
ncbi:hypothetical protein [Hahella sp. CCB-MM4]|uniref:hypothetical protein n=1 Tax=Hahella sp. (strain CCB-MM4) TaxID=1926491 RepID=UPI00114075A3|nr:hypothetical protein [Hahella sp. CCB-MM4]